MKLSHKIYFLIFILMILFNNGKQPVGEGRFFSLEGSGFFFVSAVSLILILFFSIQPKVKTAYFFVIGLVLISLSSLIINLKLFNVYSLYGSLNLLFPFLVYAVSSSINFQRIELLRQILLWLSIISLIGIFLFVPIETIFSEPDTAHGFFSDAHTLSLIILGNVVFYFKRFLVKNNKKFLLISLLLLIISYVPNNVKLILLTLLFIFFSQLKLRAKSLVIGLMIIVPITVVLIINTPLLRILRLDQVIDVFFVQGYDFAPITSWVIAIDKVTNNFTSLLVGVGPGMASDNGALMALSKGIVTPYNEEFAQYLTGEVVLISASFVLNINTWTSLLIELGMTGLMSVFAFLYFIKNQLSLSIDNEYSFMSNYLLVAVVFTGFLSPFSSYNDFFTSFVVMTFVGITSNYQKRIVKNKHCDIKNYSKDIVN